MAANIKDTAAPKKRGRPTKAEIAARNAAEAAAQREIDQKEGRAPTAAAPNKPAESAPAFGHNRATEGLFLRHVQTLRAHDVKIDASKAATKVLVGQKKDLRNLAKADGIVLGQLDEALKDLETERVDLLAAQERLQLYREWLGLPTLRTADSAKVEKDPAQIWNKRGNVAGRLGEARAIPDGCPPENGQDFLHGFDKGLDALKSDANARAEAYAAAGTAGTAAAAPVEPEAPLEPSSPGNVVEMASMLVLKEEHFAAGTVLEDCNRGTLEPSMLERWNAADNVVVVIGGKKRVLKEPDYEDTGEAGVDISEEEPVEPEMLEALREVEPELVDQVVADHAGVTEEGEKPIEDDDAESEGEPDPEAEKIAAARAADAAEFE